MRRTRAPDNAVALPAMVDTEAGGYYTAGPPATVFSADDANMIQEELVAIAGLLGVALDTTGANTSQCATALAGIKAIVAKNAEATLVDTLWTMAVIASDDATVGEDAGGVVHCLVAASQNSSAKGFETAVIASTDARAGNAGGTTDSAAVIASEDVVTEGDHSFIAASYASAGTATSTANRAVMLAHTDTVGITSLGGNNVAIIAARDALCDGDRCAIIGGDDNTIDDAGGTATDSVVAGGYQNVVGGDHCAILAGGVNDIDPGVTASAIVGGSTNGITAGAGSAIIGGNNNLVGANQGVIAGGTYNEVGTSGTEAFIGGGSRNVADNLGVAILASLYSKSPDSATSAYVALLASRYCNVDLATEENHMVCGGYDAGTTYVAPSWKIESNGGTFHSATGTIQALDYAELFPNADGKAHEPGQILARTGKGARLAKRGDRVLGGVSVTPTVLGGSDALGWNEMHQRDEWGAHVWSDVEEVTDRGPDPKAAAEAKRRLKADPKADLSDLDLSPRITRRMVSTRMKNPAYDSTRSKAHVPRTKRPDEWTAVGLLGQIRLRVDATVKAESFVVPGDVPGTGTHSDEPGRGRPIECMEITSPFDARRGYAIALCLVG